MEKELILWALGAFLVYKVLVPLCSFTGNLLVRIAKFKIF